MPALSENELIDAFEACTLAPAQLPHREHVRLAWAYLRRETLPELPSKATRLAGSRPIDSSPASSTCWRPARAPFSSTRISRFTKIDGNRTANFMAVLKPSPHLLIP